ncbi:hypothetical protein BC829DRAFT_404000 [Chytridium lagenaria]|nr:hypothetical protein BC829DRAFT_404000 [Chytridium lagenaria]
MLIAVTGANGFIATHIVAAPSKSCLQVLGTVRSLAKGSHLTSLPNATPDRLRLSFNFDGADVVLHTASPFIVNVKDPQTDLVDPARNGTLAVLEAAKAARTVKTVVLTSSIAAITMFMDNNPGCFRLVAINPTFSVDLCVKNVSIGAFPRMNIAWPLVDVRDVAKAHILGFENKTAMAHPILKVPGFSAPDPIIWIISYTMPSGNAKGYAIDASRIQNKLGMTFRKVEDSIEDTIQSLHKWGHLKRI